MTSPKRSKAEITSYKMSRVKKRDTKQEIVVRSVLHRLGYRFRLHDKNLPGTPDIVLKKHKKIIFVHGCFWHGHKNCRLSSIPKTNSEFWKDKIVRNRKRDKKVKSDLELMGWSVLIVWQCQIIDTGSLRSSLESFLSS
ncbi:very short patch repair endonuclease [candidate division LCP-89 bacterium B3_LCP]|uniref:Very short patch repair endonuclease n=1 Tax=candidate division LCP-89 bacterium B3_LCP TaxID=2012998 RepID=A0A532UZS3_UNCL8|nr:MAG: very short patch repair endonuclease [candidate division LCP-89 bacterium B3_LCP]